MSSPDHSDIDVVNKAVRDLLQKTRFPVGFGGLLSGGEVVITSIVGNRTRALQGLKVLPERGLGGRALVEHRPRMTPDYASSTRITHDYDRHVLGEGISTLIAVPIIVGGEARGVLYGGAWDGHAVDGITAAPAFQVADEAAIELRVRDEVRRRLASVAPSTDVMSASDREELRAAYADLRRVAATVDSPTLKAQLAAVETRLSALSGSAIQADEQGTPDVRLSPRETDVLACAALGGTNVEIAAQLGLKVGTVKAYIGTAMAKLDASTRHAAVAKARRAGLLP